MPIAPLRAGIALLLEAFDWAQDAGCDPWDFAVEMAALSAAGLSVTHLRWLTCKKYVQHAVEYTPRGDDTRLFRPSGKLNFRKRSCFVLTPEGRAFADLARQDPEPPAPPDSPSGPADASQLPSTSPGADKKTNGAPPADDTPTWNARLRRLMFGTVIVKEFTRPAPNQERILTTFQEELWDERVDDPLPPTKGKNAKRRLHDTINALNRNQLVPRIHFSGDGTGDGIRWQVLTGPHLYAGARNAALPVLPRRQSRGGISS